MSNVRSEPEVLADNSSPVGYSPHDLVASFFFEHLSDMVENGKIVIAEQYGCTLHKSFLEGCLRGIAPERPSRRGCGRAIRVRKT